MQITKNFPLKEASWTKIGGPAKEFIEIDNNDEFVDLIKRLVKDNQKFEVLGWGANSLIADRGLDFAVIKNKTNVIEVGSVVQKQEEESTVTENFETDSLTSRHVFYNDEKITSGYDSTDIDYDEPEAETILVKMSAGVSLPYAINYLIDKGITGLQMFSGIPGTVGGAVFNNIHGGARLLSEFIDSVEFIDKEGNLQHLDKKELGLAYNQTKFQKDKDIIISATFDLKLGDKERAKHAAVEWAKRKSSQPRNSLGSTFHNLEPQLQQQLGFPTAGIAYLIEYKLGLSGYRVGGIMIPKQTPPDEVQVNKNIFMNVDNGTAADYLAVMKKVYYTAYEMFGIKLKPEVFFKGFEKEEIKEFI